jgi:hypothetical protein
MSFPILPLPAFLLDWYPKLQELHETSAAIFTVSFGFFGLFIIALWASFDPNKEAFFGGTARDRMKMGYALLGGAVLASIFGLYLASLFVLMMGAYVLYALFTSARVVFFQRPRRITS